MHKDTKFCYSSFDISTFGFKAPPYWAIWAAIMVSGIVSGVLIYFQIWRPYKAEENSQVIMS